MCGINFTSAPSNGYGAFIASLSCNATDTNSATKEWRITTSEIYTNETIISNITKNVTSLNRYNFSINLTNPNLEYNVYIYGIEYDNYPNLAGDIEFTYNNGTYFSGWSASETYCNGSCHLPGYSAES